MAPRGGDLLRRSGRPTDSSAIFTGIRSLVKHDKKKRKAGSPMQKTQDDAAGAGEESQNDICAELKDFIVRELCEVCGGDPGFE